MTIRESILEQLIADIYKINISNGYVHNVEENTVYNNLYALDDVSVLPVISLVLAEESSELIEAGLETTIKANIFTRFKTSTDITKAGIVTDEAELWFRDYEDLFRKPTYSEVNINNICGLWNVDTENGGVDYYYISAKEPFADDTKDNIQTIKIELTIITINTNA